VKTSGSLRAESKAQRALLDLLRAPYMGGQAPAIATTNACVLLGHPAKHDIDLEHKQDWEKGCCCGHREWV
jgi:hypothetical protein